MDCGYLSVYSLVEFSWEDYYFADFGMAQIGSPLSLGNVDEVL